MPEIEKWLLGQPAAGRDVLAARLLAVIEDPARTLLERISAGNALGLLGDPRLDPLRPAMCGVPAGEFWMGTDPARVAELARRHAVPEAWFAKSTPLHRAVVDPFEIARFPVTEGEFHRFADDVGYADRPAHWRDGRPLPYTSNHPVHGVDWQAALVYAEWISERSGLQYRLPTEIEWERAARGTDAREYPWGDEWDAARCNTREGGVGRTTPVGVYPHGASPCGALDMAGNVEEIVADLYWPYPGSRFDDPAYGSYRMTRGGVFSLDSDLARCDRRHGTALAGAVGLRLARSAADGLFTTSRA
jgi:formylglycine-generating enzyme required for sulfatase activity